jgi:hypothetical protein
MRQIDPGGNLTGISLVFGQGFCGRWLKMLRELAPGLSTVAVIGDPMRPWLRAELESAARIEGLER